MKWVSFVKIAAVSAAFLLLMSVAPSKEAKDIPESIQKIMDAPRYEHAQWGLYAKNLNTGEILYDLNSNKLFSPASTTKLFSTAALLHAFGDDYRFKTPVYAVGDVVDGVLNGNLVLVGQGDLTLGGRQVDSDHIQFTKMDHIIANSVPGAILAKGDPLLGLKTLAQQVYDKGIREVKGDVLIDQRLFEITTKRGMSLSPVILNENLIDFVINPTTEGALANVKMIPEVEGYSFVNEIKTSAKNSLFNIEINDEDEGRKITLTGTISLDQKDLVRTSTLTDAESFARAAFIQALNEKGIKINIREGELPSQESLKTHEPIALWTSPPLSEYTKLILKVSHNLGADLVPLLLASQQQEKTFEQGMKLLGDFTKDTVKLNANEFVFGDAAGGEENRLTPRGEVQLLEYMSKLPKEQFQDYYEGLPVLGKDGSLEDFAKDTDAVGKVAAKTGTGVTYNASLGNLFLTTQALSGYIQGKDEQLIAFMLVVNNASLPTMEDVIKVFEDESQISVKLYDQLQK